MFSKETEYALRSLVYIQLQNDRNRRPGIDEIAEEIEAPKFYTAKILQRMVKHGVIQSIKGRGGGFYFEKDKAEVPIKELISLTEGNKTISGCGFGLKHCDNNNPCPLHEHYAPIREAINKLVSTETIQSLAKKYILKINRNAPVIS
jgi:Rrf2 family protein